MSAKPYLRYRLCAVLMAAFFVSAPAVHAEIRVVPKSQTALKRSFAPVVEQTIPSVVNVYVKREVAQRVSPFMNDPFFRRFFGGNLGVPQKRIQNSLGSGVIVSPEGIVVTNNHVIEGSGEAEITVALSDGREFPAEVVSKDERTDLAVLRLDADGAKFPAISFTDSDSLKVGDIVLAIGDPFGVGQTVTSGIVSALARTQIGVSDYQFFIQTDAAINPGNSGGALVDVDGHLVGINTAIFSSSGGSHGIGFAIPSNMVRLVVQAALKGNTLRQPWLGASMQGVTSGLAESLGLDRPRGALIAEVKPDGPVAKAGLDAGDVIVSVDGKLVQDPKALNYRLFTKGVGMTATLGVVRDGKAINVALPLVPAVEDPPRNTLAVEGRTPLTGTEVANLSPAVAQEVDVDNEGPGVVVLDVSRGSIAARIGLRKGDIIAKLNDQEVPSVKRLKVLLAMRPGAWRLTVNRDGRMLNVTIGG
ncbi:Do family serine endopeptidase [Methyloligella sp. 2.7D]|uniref:Do family serine endopeptidase n=1 Tax=unclassified Methyloligella TaxID=2625955 RepID=UPI00157D95EE|nr:Do family serine endopeptidase [Methyloligella sp. GL2]QKP77393.1 Do family serine endopeptidase [Methyloligella sp. GL2]